MAALAEHTIRKCRTLSEQTGRFVIANATQVYVGGWCQLDANGRAIPFANSGDKMIVGRALPTPKEHATATDLLGNTSLSPPPAVVLFTGEEIIEGVAVTGASAQSDVGDLVYLNATDNDITKTDPGTSSPLGVINKWITSTTCDVRVFSYAARRAFMGA